MNRTYTLIIAVAVVVGMISATPVVMGDEGTGDEQTPIQPGEQLAGVVGAQGAEFDGALQERTLGIKLAQAQTDEAAADVVAGQLTDVEDRLNGLEQRLAALEAQREAGEITQGQFAAEAAQIEAERQALERLTNQTATAAGELPADLLEERGINVEAINTLAENASELGGEEVREIAQSIAGENVGQSPAGGPGGNASDTVPAGNATDPEGAGPPDDDEQSDQPPADPVASSQMNPETTNSLRTKSEVISQTRLETTTPTATTVRPVQATTKRLPVSLVPNYDTNTTVRQPP